MTTSTSSSTSDGGATAQVQEKAQEAAGQAKDQAQQMAGQAKEQARSQIDQRSTQAGQQISQQASDIRTVGEQLREQGKDGPAKIADQAAERAEKLGSYLEESDADRILHDVEDFARQKPWMVIAGGMALGFAASRFLKASQTDRYRTVEQRRTPTPSTSLQTPATPALGGTGASLPSSPPADRARTGDPIPPSTPAPTAHPVPGVTGAGGI